MSSEFVEVNVEDFINVTDYVANGSFSSLKENVNYIENDGYAILIRLVDYNNGWNGDYRFVDKTSYEFLGKSSVTPGDIIISNVGANAGTTFKVPDLGKPMTLGPNSVILKPREDSQQVKDYLYYFFSSPIGQHLLNSITAGSAQPKFNKTDLRSRSIPIPVDGNYGKITSPLLSLDKKIHLNQQTNETLEAMAQAIFKSWFVDFDPVRAKIQAIADGRDTNRAAMAAIAGVDLEQGWDDIDAALDQKLSRMNEDQHQQLQRTAELFTDELVDSELGEIPKGWGLKTLEEVSDLNPESISPNYEGEIEYINISGVNEGDITETEIYDFKNAPSRARRLVRNGDVIWSNVRPNLKAYSLIVNPQSNTIASTGFTVIRPKFLSTSYLYNYSTTDNFISYLINSTEGSAYPAVKVSDFKRHKIIVPPSEIDEIFHDLIWRNFEEIDVQKKQNKTLTKLRDTLLPKLISGQIRV